MDYSNTTNYIFKKVGTRIKNKKTQLSLTYYQLAGYENKSKYELGKPIIAWEKYDVPLLKSIAGGKAYDGRNANLISSNYIIRLIEKLKFKDELELLWGNYKDSNFVSKLFENIFIDILYGTNEELKTFVNSVLIDYVPYAKYHSYWEIFFDNKFNTATFPNSKYKILAYFYGIKEDDIFEIYEEVQTKAIKFLFNRCQNEFEKILFDFIISNQTSFSKLNRKINDFVQDEFSNMLKEYLPNEISLGLRVRNLIISDWKNLGYFIAKNMKNESETWNDQIDRELINVSLQYIESLEKIQCLKNQSFFDIKI